MQTPVIVLITSDFTLSPAQEADWLNRLPHQRRTPLARWREPRARQRSLIASRLLVEGLKRLGQPPSALASLRYNASGRPTLDLPLHFSLSHCDGRVVCAVSACGAVGIDVEALGGLTSPEFQRYLNPAERAWAGGSARRFYAVWTQKEAVVKAADTLGLPALPAVNTRFGRQRAMLGETVWRMAPVPVGPGHIAHLALADAPAALHFERLTRQALD